MGNTQQALFLAPAIAGEVPLFGEAYMPIPDEAYDRPAELDEDQAPELDEHQAAAAAGPLVIVGCGKGKLDRAAPAGELYTGQQFRACLTTALALTTRDRIRILSAAHGLLTLDQVTAPYDVKLGAVGSVTIDQVRRQADRAGVLDEAAVIALVPAAYAHLCRSVWPEAITPLAGLGIGNQRAKLAQMRREAAAADPHRIERQRGTFNARNIEWRDHRRFCLRCLPDGRRCKDGRKAERETRLAGAVLRGMLDGSL